MCSLPLTPEAIMGFLFKIKWAKETVQWAGNFPYKSPTQVQSLVLTPHMMVPQTCRE